MPNYPGAANSITQNTLAPLPVAIYWGDSAVVWNAESPISGQASVAVAIGPSNVMDAAPSCAVELSFSGIPGAFEVDVQDADTDADGFYQSIANAIINAVNAGNAARFELSPFKGKFARLIMKTKPANAVTVTARFTR